jgi:hypothetical protein
MAKVHHKTRKAADLSLAKRQISPASYRAVLAGEITLQAARDLGRDKGPVDTSDADDGPRQASSGPREGRTPRPCMCSCGGTTKGGRFLPGHDARLHGELKRNLQNDPLLRNERFTDEQKAYAVERGLVGPEILYKEKRDG